MTTTISADQDVTTLINTFTVVSDSQQKLLDLLVEATEQVMRHLPGFISANFHASPDGARVINYAQWRSEADIQAMRENPSARRYLDAFATLATAEPRIYRVTSVHHVEAPTRRNRH
jgi:quinol monooxygenase YgiN